MTDTTSNKSTAAAQTARSLNADYDERYGFHDDIEYDFKSKKGLDHEIVEMISRYKKEPEWMRDIRHEALDIFFSKPMPTWGNSDLLGAIDFDNIHYYVRASDRQSRDWDDVPENVKKTFEKLGIPEAERKFLAGVTAQYESEVVYHSIREDLTELGVLFTDMDSALREYPSFTASRPEFMISAYPRCSLAKASSQSES